MFWSDVYICARINVQVVELLYDCVRRGVIDLVALAVSLDGNGVKFGLGDNGNLGMEVDAEIIN